MKNKYIRIIILHVVFVAFMLLNRNLLVRDIIELYLVIFLISFIFANLFYLFKKKITYIQYIKNELTKTAIVQIVVFVLIIYSTQTRYITRDRAISDLDFLVQKLESIHPDIYHCVSKDSFADILDDYKNNIPDKISELEFYRGCSRLTSLFKDGHTKLMPDLLNHRMQLAIRAIFPYRIRIVDEKIFVIGNLGWLGRIPDGSEIVGINGKSAGEFINEMSQLISYENIAWRNKLIVDPFTIGMWNNYRSYRIAYKRSGSNEVSHANSSGGIFSKIYISFYSKNTRNELLFRVLPGNIGYIGFYGCNDLKGFKSFYERTFNEIKEKNIKNLIIDIRNNGGGHSVIGAELMQYLFHKPFKETDSIAFKISKDISETGKMDFYIKPDERVIGKLFSKQTKDPYLLRENPLRFSGKSFLLIGNGTFSAAVMFASSFKCFGDGTIIGEETGGITVGSGDAHFFYLPNSKMKIMVSWKKFYEVCGIDNRRGVLPDYLVSNTVEDEIQKKDKVLEFTIDFISRR